MKREELEHEVESVTAVRLVRKRSSIGSFRRKYGKEVKGQKMGKKKRKKTEKDRRKQRRKRKKAGNKATKSYQEKRRRKPAKEK